MTDKEKRDAAVDAFAAAIKARLDEQAAAGYTGWDGGYPTDALCWAIRDDSDTTSRALAKAVDIGARAMMLHFRAERVVEPLLNVMSKRADINQNEHVIRTPQPPHP
jgi:hypothetical protein